MELLKQLFEIHSPSGREKKMKKFIRRYVRTNMPETDENAYKRDNWEYSEYDNEYYETVESYYVAPEEKKTISEDSLNDAVESGEIVEINGKYYDVSAIESIFES